MAASDGAHLLAILNQLPDAVAFKDDRHRYVRINDTLAAWCGLNDPAEAVGKSDADFFPGQIARALDEAEREVLGTGATRTIGEEKRSWPDRQVRWTSSTLSAVLDPSGAVVGTVRIMRDIGPEQQARQEVRRAEVLYKSLVDGLPQSFFRKDAEGRVVFANKRYLEVLGKSPKDVLGKTDHDFFPDHLARKYREDDARVMQTGVTLDVVEAHKPPGKKVIHVRVVKTPVFDADKRAIGVQGIFWEVPSPAEAAAPPRQAPKKAAKKAAPRKRKAKR
jgi:two-component system sensor histidine kinase/response regulator